MSHRLFIGLSALILLVAAGLRLTDLPSYPPGPHYDEAVYLMMTRSIAFGGARFFPIVEAYQGREVLWMYLNAPMLSLFGDQILTLRFTSAFLNLITIAASMALARAIFRGSRGQMIALVVGAAFALSFPQVWLARQAFRAVTLPFCQAVALWLLWRGLRANRRVWLWLTFAGFTAGCAIYTYMASRLFPLWLFIAAVGFVVFSWWEKHLTPRPPLHVERGSRLAPFQPLKTTLFKIGLFLVVMAITIAPMVVYAIQKPNIFFGRLGEVTQAENSIMLAESIVVHLRMFFIEGDPYLRYNIPNRPYFTFPEGLLLIVGIGVCLYRLIRGRGDAAERTAYLLALLSPLMIIPSVISVGGLPPSHMRSLGMIPMIFVLLGVGVEFLTSPLAPLSMWRGGVRRAFAPALIGVLTIGGLSIGTIYFDWAKRADVYYETDADLSAAAQWLANGADGDLTDTVIYLAARDKGHPTVMIEPTPPIRWIGTDTLFRAPPDMDGLYVFPRSAPPVEEWRAWLEPGRITDLPLAPDGRTAFEAFRLSGETFLPGRATPVRDDDYVMRNSYLSLIDVGYPTFESGESGWYEMAWRIDAVPPFADLTPIIRVMRESTTIFQTDVYMTDTDRWLPDEVMMIRARVDIPDGTSSDDYEVRVSWVSRTSDKYIPYVMGGGISMGVGLLHVEYASWQPDLTSLPISSPCNACQVGDLRLIGTNLPPVRSVRPGERIPAQIYWQATADMTSARLSLCIVNANGLQFEQEIRSFYNATVHSGDVMIQHWQIDVSLMLAPGMYQLASCTNDGVLTFGTLEVIDAPRVYTPPEIASEINAVFGDAIALYGYIITQDADGLRVRFVWRSDAPVDRDYSVFVHRLDAAGEIIDQQDRQPTNGETPTSLWLPGEYIIDSYTFPPDDRVVALRIGLYTPDDGQRLQMDLGGDSLIIPLE